MAFYPYKGDIKVRYYPKTASTALAGNGVVSLASGFLIKATATTTVNPGVVLRTVVAADADFADTTMVPVVISTPDMEFIADVATGTLTTAMVGGYYDLTSTGESVDVTATSHNQVTIVGFISASKAIVKINDNINYKQAS